MLLRKSKLYEKSTKHMHNIPQVSCPQFCLREIPTQTWCQEFHYQILQM